MKKLIRKITVSSVILLMTLASCSDESETMLTPRESILVAHTWKLDNVSAATSDTLLLMIIPQVNATLAATSYTRTFYKDKSCLATPGDKGTWQFLFTETSLSIDEEGSKTNYEVISLDENAMKLSYKDAYMDSEIVYTYSAH